MRQMHVSVTWQSEHIVELVSEADLEAFLRLLGGQPNARLVSYTVQPLDDAVDAAVDQLLAPSPPPAPSSLRDDEQAEPGV